MNKLIEEVIESTAKRFGYQAADILGRSRTRHLAEARAEAMSAARDLGFSFPELARNFGRDHSTIMHACRRAKGRAA